MNLLAVISVFFLIFLSFIIGGLSGTTTWLFCFYVAFIVSKLLYRYTSDNYDNWKLFIYSFIILSILGYLLTADNLMNFGTEFGFAVDDQKYFDRVIALSNNYTVKEFGLFERVFGFIALVLNETIIYPINLNNLLPFNWLLAAFVCYACHRLASQVTKKNVPHWIIYLSLIMNYNFVDAMIRFYREAFLYCFYVSAIILIYNKHYSMSLVGTIISGLVRGSNAFLLFFLSFIVFLRRKFRNQVLFFTAIITISALSVYAADIVGPTILNYASDYSRTARYESAYYGYSLQDRLENRQQLLAGVLSEGTITTKIYSQGGVVAFLAKPLVYMFFPLTLEFPIATKISNSPLASKREATGFYFFNLYKNFTIISWIVVFPLLTIGLFRCMTCNYDTQVLALFFLFSLFLIANVSGQLRHGLAFIVLIPYFVAHGWEVCRSSARDKQYAQLLAVFMFLAIGSLNVLKLLN